MINYSEYPIDAASTSEYAAMIKICKEQLRVQGFVSLKNFLDSRCVSSLVSSILDLEQLGVGFYSTERHNVFLEDNAKESSSTDQDAKSLHPRHIQLKSSKLLINANDLVRKAPELDILFQSTAFLHFIRDVLQLNLYPSSDEYGKYYANIFNKGDGLNFHFDRSEFSISLILQPADDGGRFQFVPNSREIVEGWSEMPLNTKDLRSAIAASSSKYTLEEPDLAAGDLYLFRGQNSLHRVSEITKGTRINVILTFNTEPDVMLNNYTLQKFFGVTRS
ncbi:hypothetical protein ACHAWO_000211 [Cyclotella atomus]|uniref:Fe2OG dioxygenase domain-containing protein n=1 Tax=Cyclotella atomus TaxID=382360 RepID=A0ABD3MX01_9STRA